jgi:hypothetical protein
MVTSSSHRWWPQFAVTFVIAKRVEKKKGRQLPAL